MHQGHEHNRYETCRYCGRDAAYDTRLDFCTVISCAAHLGPPARITSAPRPPSTRELVAAERAVLAAARVWSVIPWTDRDEGGFEQALEDAVQVLRELDPQ